MPETVTPPAEPAPEARILGLVLPAFAMMSVALVVYGLVQSHAWPLVHDAPLIHYVVFLMRHGMAPYRDIIEMNLPGAYLLQAAVMRTLGESAHAWWMWDTLLDVGVMAGCAWVAGRGNRSAGVAAGAWACLFHLSQGAWELGQRDWSVALAALLTLGAGLTALRNRNPRWMALYGALIVGAALIKPPIILCGLLFLLILIWQSRKVGMPAAPLVLWTVPGAALPLVASVVFLLRWHVVGEFVWTVRSLVPYYAGLQKVPYIKMVRSLHFGWAPMLVVLAGFPLWRRKEMPYLLAGTVTGVVLYLSQDKGWHYHMYMEVVFLYLTAFYVLSIALRGNRVRMQWAAVGMLLLISLRLWPMTKDVQRNVYPTRTLNSLRGDLAAMGGDALNGRVQCLDMTKGSCINALYQARLVQSTGFIYEYYLLGTPQDPMPAPVLKLQAKFMADMTARPPQLIILSSHFWPGDAFGYSHLDNWPLFRDWLNAHYSVAVERPAGGGAAGYRIYRWRGGE